MSMQNMPKSVNSENACGAEEETRGKNGLILKYDVKKIETGEPVENCFVLRPDRDPAAVAALRAYARATPNKALANDILGWVGAGGSLLAEMLGVEEDQEWEYCGEICRIRNGFREVLLPGGLWDRSSSEQTLSRIIKDADAIVRFPLTKIEKERCEAYGAKWLSRDTDSDFVNLWDERPYLIKLAEKTCFIVDENTEPIVTAFARFFPSVKPGSCLCLDGGSYTDTGRPQP